MFFILMSCPVNSSLANGQIAAIAGGRARFRRAKEDIYQGFQTPSNIILKGRKILERNCKVLIKN